MDSNGDTAAPRSMADGPIVTLDGPAGSGKSTTAKAVATRLGFRHLDSGSLYRALTLALLDADVPQERWAELTEEELSDLGVSVRPGDVDLEVVVGGRVVRDELRSAEVTDRVAFLSSLPVSRACLLRLQREAGLHGRLVADGRDMGTVVFPEADVKVYLVADLEERAKRRLRDGGVVEPTEEQISEQSGAIAARDRQDSERVHSPLKKPEDAHLIDTTRLGFEEQVQAIVDLVRDLEPEA